jgi:hypothetical protein
MRDTSIPTTTIAPHAIANINQTANSKQQTANSKSNRLLTLLS